MHTIRKDVREWISINEKIQSAFAQGARLTDDEAGLIQMCANELLAKVSGSRPDPGTVTTVSDADGPIDQAHSLHPEQTFGSR
jgi:hypothetical protein